MKKVPRNAACSCGSGKKFKNCCLHRNNTPIGILNKRSLTLVIATFFCLVAPLFVFTAWKWSKSENTYYATNKENIPDGVFLEKSQIEQYDIAILNLISARGLKGAESLDIKKTLSILDSWAQRVHSETERHISKYYKNPGEFQSSEAYFRMLMLVTVLEQDFGVRYDSALMSKPSLTDLKSTSFFKDSADLFIHGVTENRLGTCASIPVIIVSVGRRLGYPLKLVNGKAHLFARWEEGNEKFNIESGGRGMNNFPDEYYRKWPFPISNTEIKTGYYLKSLTPSEEYAGFLETRGLCLMENGRMDEAITAFTHANKLIPGHPHLKKYIGEASRLLVIQNKTHGVNK